MFFVLELAGVAALLVAVWVLFRAAKARPDDPSIRLLAYAGLIAWGFFACWTLLDIGAIAENPAGVGRTLLIVGAIVAIIFGYRAFLKYLRARADRR